MATGTILGAAGSFDTNVAGTSVSVVAILLGTGVTSVADTARTIADLTASEISTGGGYTHGTGIAMPALTVTGDTSSGAWEYSAGAATWTSAGTYTVTFRWVVICAGGLILPGAVFDYGSSQSLAAAALSFTVGASAYVTSSWPISRIRR